MFRLKAEEEINFVENHRFTWHNNHQPCYCTLGSSRYCWQ